MNKIIAAILIVLAAFVVVAQDADSYDEDKKANYNNEDFYKTEPVENWNTEYIQADKVPPDKVDKLDGKQLRAVVDNLDKKQLNNLKADNIRDIITQIDSEQLGKMNPDAIESLGQGDAENYFDDKLSKEGYNPKNPNERKLLKQIDAFSNVNFNSMKNKEGVKVGNIKTGGDAYFINTPQGDVWLNSPANVEHTGQGLKVTDDQGNGIFMQRSGKQGSVTVNGNFQLGSFNAGADSPYQIMKDDQIIGGVTPPYNEDIYSGNPVYVNFGENTPDVENYVSVGEDTVRARATKGDMNFDIPQYPPYENYKATAGGEGSVITTLNKGKEQYQITTTPDKVLGKASKLEGGDEIPLSAGLNHAYGPDNAQGIKINKDENKVRDNKGNFLARAWGAVKEKVTGSDEEEKSSEVNDGTYAIGINNKDIEELKKEENLPETDNELTIYRNKVRKECGFDSECNEMISNAKQHMNNQG